MTVIKFQRTGGVMGKEIAVEFDLDEVPGDVSQRLHSQIYESDFFKTAVEDAAVAQPDEFEYVVTVIANDSSHTVRTTDASMPESLRPLIEDLTELAKTAGNS